MSKLILPNTSGTAYPKYSGFPDGRQRSYPAPVGGGGLPLYTLKASPGAGEIGGLPTWEGAVLSPNSDVNNDFAAWEGRPLITVGSAANRVFMTGGFQNRVAEIQLPATWSTSTNPYAFPHSTILQDMVLANAVDTLWESYGRLNGITYIDGQVICGATHWYANNAVPENYMRYANAANLAGGGQAGMILVGGGRHNVGTLCPVPLEFQADLGCTHLSGHGGGLSILFTTVAGMSFYGVNAADILSATANQAVVATPLADYDADNPMGGDFTGAEVFNAITVYCGFWFVPGTKTIMAMGMNWVSRRVDPRTSNIIKYKDFTAVDEEGNGDYGGYFAHHVNNYRNFYALWNVEDLIAVKHGLLLPSQVTPYEIDYLPDYPGTIRYRGDSLIGSACWNPHINRAFFTLRRAVGGTEYYGGLSSINKLKLAGID